MVLRARQRPTLPIERNEPFVSVPKTTPAVFDLDPRGERETSRKSSRRPARPDRHCARARSLPLAQIEQRLISPQLWNYLSRQRPTRLLREVEPLERRTDGQRQEPLHAAGDELQRRGDGPAFVVPGGRTVTYKALADDVGRMANALVKLGIKPGDRVMVQVEKSIENVVLYLATLKTGAVYNPLNTAYMPAELEYFIGDAEPTVIVMPKAQLAKIEKTATANKVSALMNMEADGSGSLVDLARQQPPHPRDSAARRRRSGVPPLHLRHHRALQGRHAHAPEPVVQCPGAAQGLGVPQGRRAAARATDLPHARAVRGPAYRLPQRLEDASGSPGSISTPS